MRSEAVFKAIEKEYNRQKHNIELIASENYVSKEVLEATGSVLTNKYAEGYPNRRYYGGCECVDEVEELAKTYLKELFHAEHVNVQPHSGSQANMAVYMSVLKPGDKILGMDLKAGGHLSHGYNLNFSGQLYESFSYGVNPETERLDYDEILRLAKEIKPQMIVCGASAYAREIDFSKFREIADEVGAYLFVDMAHIAGLVAAGLHMSPMPYADFVASTTHKTLRGPRGGIILTNNEQIIKRVNKVVFPGIQGGPLMHVIAAKAVCFSEAMSKDFIDYEKQVVKNAKVLCDVLKMLGFKIVSGGTDNHLLLVDVKKSVNMTGKEAEKILDSIGITCNKNVIPYDTTTPFITSGIRLGTAAMTTRGFKEEEFVEVGKIISDVLHNFDDKLLLNEAKKRVDNLCNNFPIYEEERYV